MALRKSLGLHARELAQAMGVSRTRVTAIENQVQVSPVVVAKYRVGLRVAAVRRKAHFRPTERQRTEAATADALAARLVARRSHS